MKKISKVIKITAVVTAMAMLLCSCKGSSDKDNSSGEVDGTVNSEISGHVTFAVQDSVAEQYDEILASFEELYPNIDVEVKIYSGDLTTTLSAWATAKSLPDVVISWDNLSYFAAQGWVYPLDEFLEKDEETKYINKTSLESFVYEGKTYAVPAWLQFSTIVVNLDLLESLNMDVPDYDWTIEEFVELAKEATTKTSSGLNHTESLEQYLMETMLGGNQWGYNPETKTFDLTSGAFVNAVKTVNELTAYPQLVADGLRNQDVVQAGGQDDYAKKFGAGADGLADGKILFANQSTWDDAWMSSSFKGFDWDYYPIPAETKEDSKMIVHADYGMMLSSAKDPQAAYELLKFFTFGRDGLMARLSQAETGEDRTSRFTIPSSSHPDIVEKFNAAKNVPDGIKYMYNHMDHSVKGDFSKVLPDYWSVVNEPIWTAKDRIAKGEDAAAVAREVEKKLNEDFAASYQTFSSKMQEVQQEFDAAH